MPGRLLAGVVLLTLGFSLRAAAPSLDALYPAGGRVGATVEVEVVGKWSDWPGHLWCEAGGLRFEPLKDKGRFRVMIPEGTFPGHYLVRAFTAGGSSRPGWFDVGSRPEMAEKESNNHAGEAQPLSSLPVTVNGRLGGRGDVDCFRLDLKAGQTLVADLLAYRIQSPVDPILQITDPEGNVLAFNHDADCLDPRLAFTAPKDGAYCVLVAGFEHPAKADVRYTGGSGVVYRLGLTTGPFLTGLLPPVWAADGDTKASPVGFNLGALSTDLAIQPGPAVPAGTLQSGRVKGAEGTLYLPRVNRAPLLSRPEVAPEGLAGILEAGRGGAGRLAAHRQVDRWQLSARKGERWRVTLDSQALGFPADGLLTIENAAGKELARADDQGRGRADAELTWQAPEDGEYQVLVRDLTGRGSRDRIYLLQADREAPVIEGRTGQHALIVKAGDQAEWKVTLKREGGHRSAVQLTVEGLPKGVLAEPEKTDDGKAKEIKLLLKADAGVAPTNAPVRLLLDGEVPVFVELPGQGARGNRATNRTDHLWLTVLPAAPKKEKAKP